MGEDLAVKHLNKIGHKVLDRNFKWNRGELDIISLDKGVLVITEVKTRSDNRVAEPYRSVNRSKQRQIVRISNAYMEKYHREEEVRFDVISITNSNSNIRLNHIKGAFYPTM